MSSLIFYTDAEQALVATDTLAVQPDGTPHSFTSKAICLPHLRTIIAGTGAGQFSGDWAMMVNNRMVLSGIENLDHHTPKILQERWKDYQQQYDNLIGITTTIYHFGISENDNTMRAFAYRSANDFVSEKLEYGIGVKPECEVPDDIKLPDNLPAMMIEQRKIQSHISPNERLYIGGECITIHLTIDGFQIMPLHKFDDYDGDFQSILSAYHQ